MAQIKDVLEELNPWWKKEFNVTYKDREIYKQIKKFMNLPQIIAFNGLRRVGKTTLMFKIIDEAIKNGFDPKNIIYFSFDEFKEIEIRAIIREYEKILEKSFGEQKYLLLLDEIQKINGWEGQLKNIYDRFKENVKIIISGSESLFIRKKSKETLAGRIFEFKIEPLSFREFLLFKEINFKPIGIYENELSKLFDEFILNMGFPELIGIKDKDIIKKYIKENLIEKIIYKDIPRLFKVKDISLIESLLNLFMDEPGQIIELSKLAKEMNVSRQTISNYLIYLEESFLIKKLYNFSKNKRKTERKLKKYYPTLISIDLLFKKDDFSRSKIFEWMIINQLKAEFFWRDPYKNEVDAIMPENELIPIEIKYGKLDFNGLLVFMKKFKINTGYIISQNKEEVQRFKDKKIFIKPAFKFLLE